MAPVREGRIRKMVIRTESPLAFYLNRNLFSLDAHILYYQQLQQPNWGLDLLEMTRNNAELWNASHKSQSVATPDAGWLHGNDSSLVSV